MRALIVPRTENGPAVELLPWHGYTPIEKVPDEAFDVDGIPRASWRPFFDAISGIGSADFFRRWREAKLLIRENGVTYNVYADPRGLSRPWQLDPVPLLVSEQEAAHLHAGLIQRAHLLELIAKDIYGPQRLLNDGVLPPEFLYANPGYLRPCRELEPVGGKYLHLYAANLGRGSDGQWQVVGDRTQAPSGAGYALENRIVLARTFPEAFQDCRVQRLAVFFRTFQETLRNTAPRNRDNPHTVLLTPGPYNETYFEHSYLARYLGYTLAEGEDLTVRDNRVYLKVLGGLQPVDVIFRRLDDDYCDPLELRSDSFLGVPGLVGAVRAGNVGIANALGSGTLEAQAFNAYLPVLCKHLLGEELLLNGAPTWWCGEPVGLNHVLRHLDRLIIKPAFPGTPFEPIFPSQLAAHDRQQLVDQIRYHPWNYVGQELLPLSTVPVLEGNQFRHGRVVVRAYVCANSDGYTVMPGGLTRVSRSADELVVSMQCGGGSKDTWIATSGPVNSFSLLPQAGTPLELSRAGGELPSRAADNLFWLGRYAERADGTARLLRGVISRLSDRDEIESDPDFGPLFRALTIQCCAYPGFFSDGEGTDSQPIEPWPEVRAMLFDDTKPGSLAGVILSLVRVAGLVRDRISVDMWRVLAGLADFPADGPERTVPSPEEFTPGEMLDLLNHVVVTLSGFGGLAVESMTRGQSWRFLDMGRKLERSYNLANLLDGLLTEPGQNEPFLLEALLEIADSAMTYRRRYLGSLQAEAVVDLLVADETNPRSLAYLLTELNEVVGQLPRPSAGLARGPEQRLALSAKAAVQLAEPTKLTNLTDNRRPRLGELLGKLTSILPTLSNAITERYLSHLQVARHLAGQFPVVRAKQGQP